MIVELAIVLKWVEIHKVDLTICYSDGCYELYFGRRSRVKVTIGIHRSMYHTATIRNIN